MSTHIIQYKTTFVNGDPRTVKLINIEDACEEFISAEKDDVVEFDDIFPPTFKITKEEGSYGESYTEKRDIKYCPFCGAKLEYKEVKREKFVTKQVPSTISDIVYVRDDT